MTDRRKNMGLSQGSQGCTGGRGSVKQQPLSGAFKVRKKPALSTQRKSILGNSKGNANTGRAWPAWGETSDGQVCEQREGTHSWQAREVLCRAR